MDYWGRVHVSRTQFRLPATTHHVATVTFSYLPLPLRIVVNLALTVPMILSVDVRSGTETLVIVHSAGGRPGIRRMRARR